MADNRDWIMCQQYSDQMLADGLLTLRDQPATEHTSDVSKEPGNYVVSLDGDALYVGEAKNLAKRTRQQFRQKTSTFFKTFLTRNTESSVPIHRFHLRCTETQVGRKELEEFGIVNVPCRLNKFQLGKRSVIAASSATGGWCELQQHYAGILAQGERELLAQSFVRWSAAPPLRCRESPVSMSFDHPNSTRFCTVGKVRMLGSDIYRTVRTHTFQPFGVMLAPTC